MSLWVQLQGGSNRMKCQQRLTTSVTFLRNCVAQALSSKERPTPLVSRFYSSMPTDQLFNKGNAPCPVLFGSKFRCQLKHCSPRGQVASKAKVDVKSFLRRRKNVYLAILCFRGRGGGLGLTVASFPFGSSNKGFR